MRRVESQRSWEKSNSYTLERGSEISIISNVYASIVLLRNGALEFS